MRFLPRAILSLLLFGLTLEGLARLDDFVRDGAPLLGNHDIDSVFVRTETTKIGRAGAHFGKWQMNSLGYRGPEPVPGRPTIVTYGASETFGIYESAGHEYPRQLAQLLDGSAAAGAPAYNVVNIAIPGLRIGRMAYLDEALDKLKPAYVVVYPTPAAYIGVDQALCAKEAPSAGPARLAEPEIPATWRWRLGGKLDQLMKQVTPLWLMTALKEFGIWRATQHMAVHDTVDEAAIQAYSQDLRCVLAHIRAHGARPVLMTHATYFGDAVTPASRPMLVAWRRFYPDLGEGGFLDLERRANAAILALAQQQRDVILVRADTLVPPGPEHFADFVHFTDRGAGRIADALAQAIRAQESHR